MWFIGVEVEQATSAPPPKKILDPPLQGLGPVFEMSGNFLGPKANFKI